MLDRAWAGEGFPRTETRFESAVARQPSSAKGKSGALERGAFENCANSRGANSRGDEIASDSHPDRSPSPAAGDRSRVEHYRESVIEYRISNIRYWILDIRCRISNVGCRISESPIAPPGDRAAPLPRGVEFPEVETPEVETPEVGSPAEIAPDSGPPTSPAKRVRSSPGHTSGALRSRRGQAEDRLRLTTTARATATPRPPERRHPSTGNGRAPATGTKVGETAIATRSTAPGNAVPKLSVR